MGSDDDQVGKLCQAIDATIAAWRDASAIATAVPLAVSTALVSSFMSLSSHSVSASCIFPMFSFIRGFVSGMSSALSRDAASSGSAFSPGSLFSPESEPTGESSSRCLDGFALLRRSDVFLPLPSFVAPRPQ